MKTLTGKNNSSALRWLLAGALGMLVLIAVASLVILPLYSDYKERAQVHNLLIVLREVQAEIEAEVQRTGTLHGAARAVSAESRTKLQGLANVMRVNNDGLILARTSTNGSVLVLEPELKGTSLSWTCFGGPLKDMPPSCRLP